MKQTKKYLLLFIKISISLSILGWFITQAHPETLSKELLDANLKILVPCFLLFLIGQILSSIKWMLLARNLGFEENFKTFLNYYFIGMFFNLFLPTNVGGDFVKSYYLAKGKSSKRKKWLALYSVLSDRGIGLGILLIMACIGISLSEEKLIPSSVKYGCFALLICSLGITILFFLLRDKLTNKYKFLDNIYLMLDLYFKNLTSIAGVMLISVLTHLIYIFIHFLIGNFLKLDIPFSFYFLLYPLTSIVGLLPISFNGIGTREGTYVYLFAMIGVGVTKALTFSLIWFEVLVISSAFGVIPYIMRNVANLKHSLDGSTTKEISGEKLKI
jgi:uncharacterized membrane protein YbhN (UPF0104 family)